MKRTRVIFGLCSILFTIIILSLTIGREILAGAKLSLLSFSIINFAGYLFMFLIPVEGLIPAYVSQGYNAYLLIVLALTTALVAQIINYSIGNLMSEQVITNLIGKKRFVRIQDKICDYGVWIILIFNIFPLASSILSLTAGMVKFGLRRLLLYTFIGLLIKYVFLVHIFHVIFF